MNKFMNAPKDFVPEMLEGIALANPGKLRYLAKHNIIYRADRPHDDYVSIIQGSGSGHEPSHAMAVGPGMLDAACPGNVFAAPPVEHALECTKLMNSKKGVLYLVNNYTGDRMCWEMARELAEAEGIRVGVVFINDDVAVTNSAHTVGRRGVAGNFFVIKVCGAAAAQGVGLEQLVKLGEKVNSQVRTMGVAITGCTPPGKDAPIFTCGEREMEMGVGIHGEKGRRRAPLPNAETVVDELFWAVADDLPFENGDQVALMINGLGGTPPGELFLLYRRAAILARDRGLQIVRNYVGEYCTALEMAGFSLTLLRVDKELNRYLAAPAETAWRVF
jgi:phosphoenolpyruvate---glycerone phosphotransferase subunit DhaK